MPGGPGGPLLPGVPGIPAVPGSPRAPFWPSLPMPGFPGGPTSKTKQTQCQLAIQTQGCNSMHFLFFNQNYLFYLLLSKESSLYSLHRTVRTTKNTFIYSQFTL